jgi:hypothetical protein
VDSIERGGENKRDREKEKGQSEKAMNGGREGNIDQLFVWVCTDPDISSPLHSSTSQFPHQPMASQAKHSLP